MRIATPPVALEGFLSLFVLEKSSAAALVAEATVTHS